MIGRPYRPTDVDSEFGITHLLGRHVWAIDEDGVTRVSGTLVNVYVDGTAALEENGFCKAIILAASVTTREP